MTDRDDFIDQFEHGVAAARPAIDEKRALDEETRLAAERLTLEEQQAVEAEKTTAMEARDRTLDMAWYAANRLQQSGVPTEVWGTEPVRPKRKFRLIESRRPQVPQQKILLEGWPVMQWTYKDHKHNPTFTLVLTPPTASHEDVSLSYIVQYEKPNSGFRNYLPLTEANVHQLTDDPLSAEDMPWPKEWPAPKENGDPGELTGKEHDVFIWDARDGHPNPDFASYNAANIEEKIQAAIIELGARHDIQPLASETPDLTNVQMPDIRLPLPPSPNLPEPQEAAPPPPRPHFRGPGRM